MSEKRQDSKNRILRSGESQRNDGRYAYQYVDTFGKPQFIYAWKLMTTDKTPSWKTGDTSLREKEIQKDFDDGIDPYGRKMTVCQLYAKQNRHRGNVRHNTVKSREQLMKLLESDSLGACPIESVKMSDAKEWALRMRDRGTAYRTISNNKHSLKAAFYTAIQDDCIRKNPFDFQLNTVEVIGRLEPENQLICQRIMEGKSEHEIAAELGISRSTYTYRRDKLFQVLRKQLATYM